MMTNTTLALFLLFTAITLVHAIGYRVVDEYQAPTITMYTSSISGDTPEQLFGYNLTVAVVRQAHDFARILNTRIRVFADLVMMENWPQCKLRPPKIREDGTWTLRHVCRTRDEVTDEHMAAFEAWFAYDKHFRIAGKALGDEIRGLGGRGVSVILKRKKQ